MSHRCSLHCIVPPGMLERVARHGDDDQRGWALDTLSKDHSVRSARATNALLLAGKPKRLDVLGRRPAGEAKRTIFDMGNEEQSTGKLVRGEGDKASGDAATDEAYDGLGSTTTSTGRPSSATRSTTRGCTWSDGSTTAATTTTRSGTASGWCSGTATGSCSTASRSRLT
jgi:hypothetical protein